MTTVHARPETVVHNWFVIDATDQVLGRLASRVASVLRGKHKTNFTPHVDTGDYVVVVNASKIRLTGKKLDQKSYYRYSGFKGGLKSTTARRMLETFPERLVNEAVKGMLPKNRLATDIVTKLKVYGGADHPHAAQKPTPFPENL